MAANPEFRRFLQQTSDLVKGIAGIGATTAALYTADQALSATDIIIPRDNRGETPQERLNRLENTPIQVEKKDTLTQQELADYIANDLNPRVENVPKENDLFYGTIFIQKSLYDGFEALSEEKWGVKETAEKFVRRHVVEMNRMLLDANDRIPDYLQKNPHARIGGMEVRRIIVVNDDVDNTQNYVVPLDSDGQYTIKKDYVPADGAYWVGRDEHGVLKNIDYGFIHENGHQITAWPDIYALDWCYSAWQASSNDSLMKQKEVAFRLQHEENSYHSRRINVLRDKTLEGLEKEKRLRYLDAYYESRRQMLQSELIADDAPSEIADLPEPWKQHLASFGWSFYEEGLMGNPGKAYIDRYLALQIARRIRNKLTHDPSARDEGFWSYPPEFPSKVTLRFDKVYANKRLKLYLTQAPSHSKTFQEERTAIIPENGEVNIGDIWKGIKDEPILPSEIYAIYGLIPSYRFSGLIRIEDPNAAPDAPPVAFMPFDGRPWNEAYWLDYEEATIQMPLATAQSETPNKFKFREKFKIIPNKLRQIPRSFLPFIGT